MKFAGVDPATFGFVKVTGWKDERQPDGMLSVLTYRGGVRGAVRQEGLRQVTVTFLVLGEDEVAIRHTLSRLTGWLTAPRAACALFGEGEAWRYYRARCQTVSAPERQGLTARVTAVFQCEDPRPYSTATGKPMIDWDAPLCDFTFAGKHCYRDFGLLFEETGYQVLPAPDASIYRIPGRDGTIRMADAGRMVRTITGRLYLCRADGVDAPLSQGEARSRMHRVAEWLTGAGRAPLIMDYEPDKYYEAEVLDAPVISTEKWPNGCFEVTFVCQSAMLSVERGGVEKQGISEPTLLLLFPLKTGMETPLVIDVWNTSDVPLTGVDLSLRDGSIFSVRGLSLGSGDQLTVDGEKQTVLVNGKDAFECYAGGAFPAITGEPNELRVTPYGGATVSALASIRGRWL